MANQTASAPLVTLVVVPRERFSYSLRSLENIYENTSFPFHLIYVDGNSPTPLRWRLQEQAQQKGFSLIRADHYLSPTEARNLGLREVETKYVVFIDNDVLVQPGWLEKMVVCAEETAAWVVGPLYLIGDLKNQIIHMAGGTVTIQELQGKRILYEECRYSGERLNKIPITLRREQVDLVEFHCMLARADLFVRLGALDERLLNIREHVDLCMRVRQAGGTIFFEPDAVTTHVPPPHLAWSDLHFYMLRWSEAWTSASLQHFNEKWKVEVDRQHITWLRRRRRLPLRLLEPYLRRVLGQQTDRVKSNIIHPLERHINRLLVRLHKDSRDRKNPLY